ncbi:hypothetical protein A4G29_13155 [Mycobacterium kansasii]|nr:hypothetical protein A4G29_13155 [Mycobacterium kansasii]
MLPAGLMIAKAWPVAVGRSCAGLRVVVWASAARPSASVRLVVWVTAVPVAVRPGPACPPAAVQQRRPVCRAVQSAGVRAAPVVRRTLAVVPTVGPVVRVVPAAVPVGPAEVRRSAWEAVATWARRGRLH